MCGLTYYSGAAQAAAYHVAPMEGIPQEPRAVAAETQKRVSSTISLCLRSLNGSITKSPMVLVLTRIWVVPHAAQHTHLTCKKKARPRDRKECRKSVSCASRTLCCDIADRDAFWKGCVADTSR